MKRKAITKKDRFEVFKRDKFTCQYCGAIAPDVVLELDHIIPVARGGTNDIMNYITACKECNAGKKHRELSDQTVIQKQKRQLDDLEDRRQQLKMMVQWREEIENMDSELVVSIKRIIDRGLNIYGKEVSGKGKETIRGWLKKFDYNEICEAINSALQQDINNFWSTVPKILQIRKSIGKGWYIKDIYYIRKILINRDLLTQSAQVSCGIFVQELKKIFVKCVDNDFGIMLSKHLKELAKKVNNVDDFWDELNIDILPFINDSNFEFYNTIAKRCYDIFKDEYFSVFSIPYINTNELTDLIICSNIHFYFIVNSADKKGLSIESGLKRFFNLVFTSDLELHPPLNTLFDINEFVLTKLFDDTYMDEFHPTISKFLNSLISERTNNYA